ncbi:MAG TPA: hypothetical protein VKV32_16655 [Stellaceae bacterium]|nr:hypothetical protein [Stellaceae bacterium]
MARNRLIAMIAVAAVLAVAEPALAFQLISPQEAKLPAAQVVQIATRGLTRGPTVKQVSPPPNTAAPSGGSLTLDIAFDAHNGATIDPAKVKVIYMKQPAIDLTPRLRPFITPNGIDATDVQIPPGTHMLRVEVTDSDGRSTTQIMTIQVAAN